MKKIDEERLETDRDYRYEYLAEFIGFGPEDVALIQGCAMHLGPRIPELVQATYDRLLEYDATARHFLPRQHGLEGDPPADLSTLSRDHPHIRFRMDHLTNYFTQLIGRNFDPRMVLFLDTVGKIHTHAMGNKEIFVPLVQMNALLGLLSDIFSEAIASMPLEPELSHRTVRAFHKLLWIQNDFINRSYATTAE